MHTLITRCAAGLAAASLAVLVGCGGGNDGGGNDTAAKLTASPDFSCIPPPEGQMTELPPGVFGGKLKGYQFGKISHPDRNFILVTWFSELFEVASGVIFHGPDLATSGAVTGSTRFSLGGGCSSEDPQVRNGTHHSYKSPIRGDSVYVNVSLEPDTPKVSGSLRFLAGKRGTYSLSGGPIPGSTYDPAASPALGDIVGDWAMTDQAGRALQVSVAGDGKLTGSYPGCPFTGTVAPAKDGLNRFSVTLGLAPCTFSSGTPWQEGFALAVPLNVGGKLLLLRVVATDWAGSNPELLFFGRR